MTGPSPSLRPYLGVVAAAGLLLAGGVAYRALAAYLGAELATPIRLDPPLATLPLVLGPWQGEDVPLREGVLRIAGNDDYVSRSYRHMETGEVVSLYIGYTARPRTMLRHRPSVCYPSAGWTPLAAVDEELNLRVALAPLATRYSLFANPSPPNPTSPRSHATGEGRDHHHHRGTETQRETGASEVVPPYSPPSQVAPSAAGDTRRGEHDSLWPGGVEKGSEPSDVPTSPCAPVHTPAQPAAPLATRYSLFATPSPSVPSAPRPLDPLTPSRSSLPVRLQSFLRPGVPEQRVVVLNYYVLHGVPTLDEYSFWGLRGRDPNRDRDASRYVAQVQIAAAVRTTPDAAADLVRRFAADSAPAILPLLPAALDAAPSSTGDSP